MAGDGGHAPPAELAANRNRDGSIARSPDMTAFARGQLAEHEAESAAACCYLLPENPCPRGGAYARGIGW